MHRLDDLGLPNQRRWLNHRNSVTITAERYPPPGRILAQRKELCPWYLGTFLGFLRLAEGEFAGPALLVLEAGSHLQKAVEHFGALGAARCQLRVGLFVHVLEAM